MTDKHANPINPNNSANTTDPTNPSNHSEDLQKPQLCISEVGTSFTKPDSYEMWLHIKQEYPDDTKALEMVEKIASDLKCYLKSLKDMNISVSSSEYKLCRDTHDGTNKKWKKGLPLSIASVDVIVVSDNFGAIHDIISHAIELGVTSISNIKFKLHDEHTEAQEAQAIRNAMTKAAGRIRTIAHMMDITLKNPEVTRVSFKSGKQSLSNEELEAVFAATFSDRDILHNVLDIQYIKTTAIIDLVYEYNKTESNDDDLIIYDARDSVVRRNRGRFYEMLDDDEIENEIDGEEGEIENEINQPRR